MAIQGERITVGFILITGIDGIRYAVRHHSVAIFHAGDECHDETIVQLHGGHVVRVPCPLDEVLGLVRIGTGVVPLYGVPDQGSGSRRLREGRLRGL